MGTVWQSSNPEEDVARGAAWWTEVGLGYPDVRARKAASLDSFKPEEEPTVQTATSTLDSETDPKLIPPWKR
jgi:hypothetical protein